MERRLALIDRFVADLEKIVAKQKYGFVRLRYASSYLNKFHYADEQDGETPDELRDLSEPKTNGLQYQGSMNKQSFLILDSEYKEPEDSNNVWAQGSLLARLALCAETRVDLDNKDAAFSNTSPNCGPNNPIPLSMCVDQVASEIPLLGEIRTLLRERKIVKSQGQLFDDHTKLEEKLQRVSKAAEYDPWGSRTPWCKFWSSTCAWGVGQAYAPSLANYILKELATVSRAPTKIRVALSASLQQIRDVASVACPAKDDEVGNQLLEGIKTLKAEVNMLIANSEFGGNPEDLACEEGRVSLAVQNMSGNLIATLVGLDPDTTTVFEVKRMLYEWHGVAHPRSQKLFLPHAGETLNDEDSLGLTDLQPSTDVMLITVTICEICGGDCVCSKCHGFGVSPPDEECPECGKTDCEYCGGKCKCFVCHGHGQDVGMRCKQCKRRGREPCWGGDTFVLMPGGQMKQVRDIRVGDIVRTVKGSRRVARVWSGFLRGTTELCFFRGVWITSHHPIVLGRRWVFPADVLPTTPWQELKEVVRDVHNLELEGHDDTVLLWGAGAQQLIVSCTIGKYLGPRFGFNIGTRRSTRCSNQECAQCEAVYISGLDFSNLSTEMRWKTFAAFPQVEWDGAEKSEFEWAEEQMNAFCPTELAPVSLENMPQLHTLGTCRPAPASDQMQTPAWKAAARRNRRVSLASGRQVITEVGLKKLLDTHGPCSENSLTQEQALLDLTRFGLDATYQPIQDQGTCAICFEQDCKLVRPCLRCNAASCMSCIKKYLFAQSDPLAVLPPVNCPLCQCRVPLKVWESLGYFPSFDDAAALLTVHCTQCDMISSLAQPLQGASMDLEERRRLLGSVFSTSGTAKQAMHIWQSYAKGCIGAEAAAAELLTAMEQGSKKQQQFAVLLGLVDDLERRLGLQLALLHHFPQLSCPRGCGNRICFLCKRPGHQGQCAPHSVEVAINSTAQKRRYDADKCQPEPVERCPSCRSEWLQSVGTLSMICYCGQYWEHSGYPSVPCQESVISRTKRPRRAIYAT